MTNIEFEDGNIELEELIKLSLIEFDKIYIQRNIPIKDRPSQATSQILKHCLTVENLHEICEYEDNEYYLDTPVYPAVYDLVRTWYNERYGAAAIRSDQNIQSLMFFWNCPFLLDIPYSKSIDEGNPDTFLLKFLDEFNAEIENWEEYIASPPKIKEMEKNDYESFKAAVIESIDKSRNVFYSFTYDNEAFPEEVAFSKGVLAHLRSAAQLISSLQESCYNLAIWELQMALEKSFKLILMQRSGGHPLGHNLVKLYKSISGDDYMNLTLEKIKKFPPQKEVLSIRYGSPQVNLSYAESCYSLAIDIINDISKLVRKKKINARKMTVVMKRPKYAGATFKKGSNS